MDGHQLGTDSRSSAVQAGGGEFGGGGRADGQGMIGQRDRGAVFRETDRGGVFPLNESNWF